LVSFRVAQTLPQFVLQGLEADTSPSLQHVFSQAFHKASLDLEEFAERHGLDFMESGTSCSAVLRQGDKVFVSWLGDCRVLLATVGQGNRRVDFMSKPHLASSAAEYRRLCKAGLPVSVETDDPARIFNGTSRVPGLTIARALGDFVVRQGVICEPEGANSSFEGVPGLVFLASGGLCEHFGPSPGEAMLQTLAVDGALLDKGPDNALQTICSVAQRQWQNRQNAYSEDISGILIQWVGAGRTPATLTALPKATSLQARLASNQLVQAVSGSPVVQSLGQATSLASHMRMAAPISRNAQTGQVLANDRIKQAASSLPARTAVAASTIPARTAVAASSIATSQPITSQLLAQGEPRKFLQAQPQNPMPAVAIMAKEVEAPVHPSFLQAVPGRLTTVLE
jgi:serine/threonine protein phosphatase PrpC